MIIKKQRRLTAAAGCYCRLFYRTASALSSSSHHISSLSFHLDDPTLLPLSSSSSSSSNDDSKKTTFPVYNPAATSLDDDDAIIATMNVMGRDDTKKAIDRTSRALPSWRDDITGPSRGKILQRWSDLMNENINDLATIMTLESGKPLAESTAEVTYASSFLAYASSDTLRPSGPGGGFLIPTPFSPSSSRLFAEKRGVGVCGLITPWNFPLAMITRKVGPALAAGCGVVVKPSELTPLSAVAVRELGRRAGVPRGVFELVTSDATNAPDVGHEMCTNSIVKKISFTGSTKVGKLLMSQSADTVKRLSLELGGNAPFIVFDDANLDHAVAAAMSSKFRNAGQTCVCSDRFLIHESIIDEFSSRLVDAVRKGIKVGRGMEEGTTMGPLITVEAARRVRETVEEAIKEGSRVLYDGNTTRSSSSPLRGETFLSPIVLSNVPASCRLWSEETFGPVVAMRSFSSEEEAVVMANDSESGLACYFCTRDVERIFRVSNRLEAGLVGVNAGIMSTALAPFGGVKESGLGREGSPMGIEEYLETKYVFLMFDDGS